jgi:phosphinothricin acetyltransferase
MIRTARETDAAAIAEIYWPYVADTFISFEDTPPDAQQMRSRLAEGLERFPWLVSETDGRIDGYAYASQHRTRAAYRWSVDVSAYVRSEVQRRGIGRALYSTLLPLLARQNYKNAFAGIALPNDASVGLHECMGFLPIGVYRDVGFKLGVWRDVGWWGITLNPSPQGLAEPVDFSSLPTSRERSYETFPMGAKIRNVAPENGSKWGLS